MMDSNIELSLSTPPVVSIILSVLNGEGFLALAIESILEQTLTNLELIIVDDGSIDRTWEIITTYAQNDPRIVPIHIKRNIGTSAALNKGLQIAQGQYITRQDGDDVSLPERLACQVEFLEKNKQVSAVGTTARIMNSFGELEGILSTPLSNAEIQETLLDYMCFCGPTVMCRREHLQAAGFYFDETLSYSEDYDLCLRLAEVGEMGCLAEPLYLYRKHAESVSITRRYQQMFRKALAMEKAVTRRGITEASHIICFVGRDFFRAAVLAWIDGNPLAAQEALERAQMVDNHLFDRHDQIATIINRYFAREPLEKAIPAAESLFGDLLPPTPHLRRLKRVLLADLHIKAAFSNQDGQTRAHLWRGIRYNPWWLRNRGVLSLLWRHTFSF